MSPDVPDGDVRVPELARVPMGTLDFLRAAEETMAALAGLTGLPTWMVARDIGGDSIALAVHDQTYGLTPGASLRAFPTLRPLVEAEAPALVVPCVSEELPDELDLRDEAIDCLVALPLKLDHGAPFGMVYGVGPSPHPDPQRLQGLRPALTLVVYLLGTVLALDLDRSRLQRKVDAAESAALSDELTGLGNRRAFERAVRNEQARCERFGHLAGVMIVDLDDMKVVNDRDGHAAGDALLCRTADVLRGSVRDADQAFRVGGDEFALLLPEVSSADLESLRKRLKRSLAEADISASVGGSIRRAGVDLHDVVAEADASMYVEKSRHHGSP